MFHNEDLENAMEPVLQVINSGFFFSVFYEITVVDNQAVRTIILVRIIS